MHIGGIWSEETVSGPEAAAVLMQRQSTLPVRPKFGQLSEYSQSMLPLMPDFYRTASRLR